MFDLRVKMRKTFSRHTATTQNTQTQLRSYIFGDHCENHITGGNLGVNRRSHHFSQVIIQPETVLSVHFGCCVRCCTQKVTPCCGFRGAHEMPTTQKCVYNILHTAGRVKKVLLTRCRWNFLPHQRWATTTLSSFPCTWVQLSWIPQWESRSFNVGRHVSLLDRCLLTRCRWCFHHQLGAATTPLFLSSLLCTLGQL